MPIEDSVSALVGNVNISLWGKLFLILFIIFYIFFAFMLFKQIQLMTRELATPAAPYLKFLGLINVGVAIALLFIVLGIF